MQNAVLRSTQFEDVQTTSQDDMLGPSMYAWQKLQATCKEMHLIQVSYFLHSKRESVFYTSWGLMIDKGPWGP